MDKQASIVLVYWALDTWGTMTRRAVGRVIAGFLLLAAPAMAAESPAEVISGFRVKYGEVRVVRDATLDRIALEQARAMAAKDHLSHEVLGPFRERLRVHGYRAKTAAENIGAGHHTLAEAFSSWRGSPPHNANMLLDGATRMGIAAAYSPKAKYKVFWALILAAPEEGRG